MPDIGYQADVRYFVCRAARLPDGTALDSLAAPPGTTSFFSALYNSPFSTRWFVLTFGTDTSLTTGPGWDNVTGVGTPNGLNFVNAIAP
jgi:hypothetical protein